MNAIATVNADTTERASSVFSAEDVLSYYESTATFNSSDRMFIIEKGSQEWLLADNIDYMAGTSVSERVSIRVTPIEHRMTELVILIANLIGGEVGEPV